MTFTIGRASFDNNPSSIRQSGDRLDIDINILPATLAEAKVLRQQVLGLADNDDEPVVPLTWSDDSDYDGFYRVAGADVEPTQAYLSNRLMRARLSLVRVVNGYANPVFELYANCVEYTNPHSITTYGRVAFPQTGLDFDNGDFVYNGSQLVTVQGGYVRWHRGDSLPVSGTASYYVNPSDAYVGASTFEVSVGGAWYEVAGRQVPELATAGGWRITNGLIRISPNFADPEYTYVIEYLDSGSWVTLCELERGVTGWTGEDFAVDNPRGVAIGGGVTTAFASPTILRNGPERVTVKLPQIQGFETLSLLRGAGWVEGLIHGPSSQFGVGSLTTIAMTDNTYGGTRTSADANGNTFFIGTPVANTVDTTNGRVVADATSTDFVWLAGLGGNAVDSGIPEASYAFTANAITQRVVAR